MTDRIFTLTTQRDCMTYLVDRRRSCRTLTRLEDQLHEANRQDVREATRLRELKNPMATRRAEVLDAKVASRREALHPIGNKLMEIGRELIVFADVIDNMIPRGLLLDLLNVNPVDRDGVKEARGFKELIFVHGVENSVERRGEGWNGSPLFCACHRWFMHELIHNEELSRMANDILFGEGGMFEFIPTYQQMPDGSMKRLRPPLRVVDGTPPPCAPDVAGGAT